MGQISEDDVRALVAGAVGHVFESMMSVKPKVTDHAEKWFPDGGHIAGSVGFAGRVNGILCIHLSYDHAQDVAAAMLGMGSEDGLGEEEVRDVVGELSNMVGGNFKSRLCDKGLACELSIPSITLGERFMIAGLKGTTRYGYAVDLGKDKVVIEVYIRQEG